MKVNRKGISYLFLALALQAVPAQAMSSSMIERGKEILAYLKDGDDMRAKLCRLGLCVGGFATALYLMRETKVPHAVAECSTELAHRFPSAATASKYLLQSAGLYGALKVAYPGASTSEQTFHLANVFAQGVIEASLKHAAKNAFERVLASGADAEVHNNRITFADIAGGVPEAVRNLITDVQKLDELAEYGLAPAKGFLFYGPPGTGKTLLAQAVAGEMPNCAFFAANGASFVNQYVGTGPAGVRALFAQAQRAIQSGRYRYALIFIDEIDGVGKRSEHDSGGSATKEYNNTINTLLTCLDGVGSCPGIFVIGATNRPRLLDDALIRSGRLGTHIEIPSPSQEVRKALFDHYLNTKFPRIEKATCINTEQLATATEGLCAADIAGLVAGAAGQAVRTKSEGQPPVITHELLSNFLSSRAASSHEG